MSGDPHFVCTYVGQHDVVRTHDLARVPQGFLGADEAFRIVRAVFGKILRHLRAAFALLREVEVWQSVLIDSLIEHPQCVCEIADEFYLRMVVDVDFRRQGIDMQYPVAAVRVAQLGM
jgi:hypothetical protein